MEPLGLRSHVTESNESAAASARGRDRDDTRVRLPIVRQDDAGQSAARRRRQGLRVRHCAEGRIRLRLAALREDAVLTERLREALEDDPRVIGVRINRACASLVIHHQRAETRQEALVAAVAILLARLLAERATSGSGPNERSRAKHQGLRAQRASKDQVDGTPPRPRPKHRRRRPPVTWPLADLAAQKTEAHEHPRRQSARPETAAPSSRRPQGLRLSRFRKSGCWLCGVHRWMTRWYLRLSLRCWWGRRC